MTALAIVAPTDAQLGFTVAPYGHTGGGSSLYLEAELDFRPPSERPEDDVETVVAAVQTAYDFITTGVTAFARSFMP